MQILVDELFSPGREADPGYVDRGGGRIRKEETG
jgi:hypothetical protein